MTTNVNDLEALAEKCLAAAKTLKTYLAENGHSQPSFDQNGPGFWPDMDLEAEFARMQLREVSRDLYALASGPDEMIGSHSYSTIQELGALRYVYRFKISPAVPDNDTISYLDLAIKTGTDAEQLKQMLRMLMTSHIFSEPLPGHVAHTAASKAIQHKGVNSFLGWTIYHSLPFIAKQTEAMEKWGHGSQEGNETGLQLVYNTDKVLFHALEDQSEARYCFEQLMTYVSTKYVSSVEHILAYDWASLGPATIVDVGGGVGHCSAYIAKANPQAKCVVQDLPGTIHSAKDPETSVIPIDLRDRVSFQVHNFFDVQPIQGAEVYFLRMILHHLSDKYCVKLLRALIPAMKPGSKIVIMDLILPQVGDAPATVERAARTMDVAMLLLMNAKERDLVQWTSLFAVADPRLKIQTIIRPPKSMSQIIEVILVEDTEVVVNGDHAKMPDEIVSERDVPLGLASNVHAPVEPTAEMMQMEISA